MSVHYRDDSVTVHAGDCLEILRELDAESIDAVVTDPPYGLEFMGKAWDRPWAVSPTAPVGYEGRENNLTLPSHRDSRNANCRACGGRQRGSKRCDCVAPQWDRSPSTDMREFQSWCEAWAAECLRVLKPGGHIAAFGGSRTSHRLTAGIEDAGFEIRDSMAWLYGSGFPKSLDVAKSIDGKRCKARHDGSGRCTLPADHVGLRCKFARAGEQTDSEAAWQGWGTALKPAFEPIILARKPLRGTVATNVVQHGTGALNIDACRVQAGQDYRDKCASVVGLESNRNGTAYGEWTGTRDDSSSALGRFPANVLIDESAAEVLDQQSGHQRDGIAVQRNGGGQRIFNHSGGLTRDDQGFGGEGGASRFFPVFKYAAKAPGSERPMVGGVAHPTVKPLELMRWLVKLITPPHGLVLDPFAGSGTTAEACVLEHMRCITIEREPDYLPLIVARLTKPIAVGFDFSEPA